MTKKKENKQKKKYDGYALSVCLANKCYQRNEQTYKTAHGCYNRTINQDTLADVLAEETTVVNEYATPIGYLKICVILFKVTFLHKKGKHGTPILKGFFLIQ